MCPFYSLIMQFNLIDENFSFLMWVVYKFIWNDLKFLLL